MPPSARDEMNAAVEVEYAAAEADLVRKVEALLRLRHLVQDRRKASIALVLALADRGEIPVEGPALGLLAVALDRLADLKEGPTAS